MGIEPTSEAWEAPILPLNYARSLSIVLIIQRLSESRTQRLFSSFSKIGRKPFFLGDLQFLRVVADFVSLFRPAN